MKFTRKYDEYSDQRLNLEGMLDLLSNEELDMLKEHLGITYTVNEGIKDFFTKLGTKVKSSFGKMKDWVKKLFSGKLIRIQKRVEDITGKSYPKEEIGAIMRLNPEHTKRIVYESYEENSDGELMEIVHYDQSAATVVANKFDRWADWVSYVLDKLKEYCKISNDEPFAVLTTKNKLYMFRKWRIQKYGVHQYEKQYSLDKV